MFALCDLIEHVDINSSSLPKSCDFDKIRERPDVELEPLTIKECAEVAEQCLLEGRRLCLCASVILTRKARRKLPM